MAVIGSVEVEVVPSARGFVRKFQSAILPEMDNVGRTAGDRFGGGFAQGARPKLEAALRGLTVAVDADVKTTGIREKLAKAGSDGGGAFGRAFKERVRAAADSLPDFKIDAVTGPADRKIAGLRAQLDSLANARIGVELSDQQALRRAAALRAELKPLLGDKRIDVSLNARRATAELEKFEAGIHDIDQAARSAGGPSGGLRSALIKAAVALSPALIPLSAAAAGLFAGLVAGAGAAAVGIKGISDEVKSGTVLGQRYSQQLDKLRGNFKTLERTAAINLFAPFASGVSQVQKLMPSLNVEVGKFSRVAGQIGSNALVGLIAGFHSLEPLLDTMAVYAVRASEAFKRFAQGNGLREFGSYAQSVMPQVAATLAEVATAVGHLVQGLAPLGVGVLGGLRLFSELINAIPVGAVQQLAPAVLALGIAFKSFQASRGLQDTLGTLTGRLGSVGAAGGLASRSAGALSKGLKFLGPVGAVAAVGIGVATFAFSRHAENARKAQQAVDGLTEAIKRDNGALGQQSQTNVIANLEQQKAFVAAKQLGLGYDVVTQAALRNKDATRQVAQAAQKAQNDYARLQSLTAQQRIDYNGNINADTAAAAKRAAAAQQLVDILAKQQQQVSKAQKQYQEQQQVVLRAAKAAGQMATSIDSVAGSLGLSTEAAKQYAALVGIVTDKSGVAFTSTARFKAALETVKTSFATASQTGSQFLAALQAFSQSSGTAADRATILGAYLKASQGDALSFAGQMVNAASAINNLRTSFDAAQRGAINLKTGTIDYNNAAAGPLIQNLQAVQDAATAAATATFQHEVATRGSGTAAKDAASVFRNDTYNALLNSAKQLGITSDQARRLADRYFHMPKSVTTAVEAIGTKQVVDVLGEIGKQLSFLTHQPWNPKVGADTATAQQRISDFQARMNALHGKNVKVNADTGQASAQLGSLKVYLDALQNKTITVTTIPISGGRSNTTGQNIAQKATGGHITGPGTGTSDSIPAWLSNGEYVINAKATKAFRPLLDRINSTVPAFASGGYIMKGYATGGQVRQVITPRELSISRPGVRGEISGITASTPVIAAAVRTLSTAVARAFSLRGVETKLAAAKAKLDGLISSATDLRSTVGQNLALDVGTAGANSSGYVGGFGDILSAFQNKATSNRAFSGKLSKLHALGYSDALIGDYASKGDTNALNVLAGSSKSQAAQLSRAYAAVQSSQTGAANNAANLAYGKRITSARSTVTAESRQVRDLTTQVTSLTRQVNRLSGHRSTVSIGSDVIADINTFQNTRVVSKARNNVKYGRKR